MSIEEPPQSPMEINVLESLSLFPKLLVNKNNTIDNIAVIKFIVIKLIVNNNFNIFYKILIFMIHRFIESIFSHNWNS